MPAEPPASTAHRDAADCLGVADAALQLATLWELEALAVARPAQRQPVVDAVCSFLRTPANPADTDVRGEALRMLARHLRHTSTGEGEFWDGMSVDLSGATLVDADFSGCRLTVGRFADTRFQGEVSFAAARFEEALFWRALFQGDAGFTGVRIDGSAAFGRTRFHGAADFDQARFGGIAWFGRGEECLDDDDPLWETVEQAGSVSLPWDELNETDPSWPSHVLVEDYQEWTEGGDGARFNGRASFQGARFDGPAWFWKARFGGVVTFRNARFNDCVGLDQPTVDLTGAQAARPLDDDDAQDWPFGWTRGLEREGLMPLVADESVRPYARQLADSSPQVRLSGLRILADLGDATPALRRPITDALCGYLRIPLSFDLSTGPATRTTAQTEELDVRRVAQQLLTERLRPRPRPAEGTAPVPAAGPQFWDQAWLRLSGATLIDFDLTDCRLAIGDFSGTQFHGVTSFARTSFSESTHFCLPGGGGSASFHGPVTFAGARLPSGTPRLRCCDPHARMTDGT
ncbi:pentapeptide repeat-containing protein [Kitasatospora azatica]|uniref:pentapeptide repeat-containing protein n=1 Tax=Kitasatospora azatica TaxID=58347 RepID=UPI0005611693|nr:pentapeptide repeat-containing protein [Kitasatospora azatica]